MTEGCRRPSSPPTPLTPCARGALLINVFFGTLSNTGPQISIGVCSEFPAASPKIRKILPNLHPPGDPPGGAPGGLGRTESDRTPEYQERQ